MVYWLSSKILKNYQASTQESDKNMSLIKWTPFIEPFEEMEKAMSEFSPLLKRSFVPAVDVYEDKNNVIVETELAGIDPDKVNISIENDVLCIKGEAEKKSEVDDKNYYRKEIRRGSFYRSVTLPSHVDGDKAEALADAGVLKVTIPKMSGSTAKNIKIKTKKS